MAENLVTCTQYQAKELNQRSMRTPWLNTKRMPAQQYFSW